MKRDRELDLAIRDSIGRYRRYLLALDHYAPSITKDELLELIGSSEAIDLLVTRDELDEADLRPEEIDEVRRLDDLLITYREAVLAALPLTTLEEAGRDRPARWWWRLHAVTTARSEAEQEHRRQVA